MPTPQVVVHSRGERERGPLPLLSAPPCVSMLLPVCPYAHANGCTPSGLVKVHQYRLARAHTTQPLVQLLARDALLIHTRFTHSLTHLFLTLSGVPGVLAPALPDGRAVWEPALPGREIRRVLVKYSAHTIATTLLVFGSVGKLIPESTNNVLVCILRCCPILSADLSAANTPT